MWLESFLNHNIFYPMKRPSRIERLRIVLNSWFPPGSFSMTLFGTVYTKSSYAAENLGSENDASWNFSKGDLLADVDAINIAGLVQKGLPLSDALEAYYVEGLVERRFSSFISSYGGWYGFISSVYSSVNTYSPLNRILIEKSFSMENVGPRWGIVIGPVIRYNDTSMYINAAKYGFVQVIKKNYEQEKK